MKHSQSKSIKDQSTYADYLLILTEKKEQVDAVSLDLPLIEQEVKKSMEKNSNQKLNLASVHFFKAFGHSIQGTSFE